MGNEFKRDDPDCCGCGGSDLCGITVVMPDACGRTTAHAGSGFAARVTATLTGPSGLVGNRTNFGTSGFGGTTWTPIGAFEGLPSGAYSLAVTIADPPAPFGQLAPHFAAADPATVAIDLDCTAGSVTVNIASVLVSYDMYVNIRFEDGAGNPVAPQDMQWYDAHSGAWRDGGTGGGTDGSFYTIPLWFDNPPATADIPFQVGWYEPGSHGTIFHSWEGTATIAGDFCISVQFSDAFRQPTQVIVMDATTGTLTTTP